MKTETEPTKLTPEQIKNWRNVLCVQIGPYALIAPDSEIQAMKDEMQRRLAIATN